MNVDVSGQRRDSSPKPNRQFPPNRRAGDDEAETSSTVITTSRRPLHVDLTPDPRSDVMWRYGSKVDYPDVAFDMSR